MMDSKKCFQFIFKIDLSLYFLLNAVDKLILHYVSVQKYKNHHRLTSLFGKHQIIFFTMC